MKRVANREQREVMSVPLEETNCSELLAASYSLLANAAARYSLFAISHSLHCYLLFSTRYPLLAIFYWLLATGFIGAAILAEGRNG